MNWLTAGLARLIGIVRGLEMEMTKEMGGIESGDRETGRKEQCSDF